GRRAGQRLMARADSAEHGQNPAPAGHKWRVFSAICRVPNARCDKLTTQKPIHAISVDLAVIGPWFPPPLAPEHRWGSANVSIISSSLRAGPGAERRPSGLRMVRLFAAALTAATLAACAQQPPVMTGTSRQAAVQPARKVFARHHRVAPAETT